MTGSGVGSTRRPLSWSLRGFTGAGYDKGRSVGWQAAWYSVQYLVFRQWWCPARLRSAILRAFGADVAEGVLIRHNVRITWPWKLSIGANTWVGEGVWILNLAPVTIGSDTCLSQEAFLCTGSHQMNSSTFEFDNGPIVVGDNVWLATQSLVLRGVTVGDRSVVGARAVVRHDLAPDSLVPVGTTA
jgi:putative colanic acid biosynthesis acetyltransferase WcaF